MKIISRLFVSLIAVSAISANAALYNRGNGMIYDSSLNITWLQDANYAQTSGYDANGLMTWNEAKTWSINLEYGGFSDWRLSSGGISDTPDECVESFSYCPGLYNGTYDRGFNNTRSEIGHLFLELGNKAYYNFDGQFQSDYGFNNTTFVDGATGQSVSFLNIQNNQYAYWEAERYLSEPYSVLAFSTSSGGQGPKNMREKGYVWAVRDGDVLPVNEVPVPAAALLMGSGLIGLAGIARRKK